MESSVMKQHVNLHSAPFELELSRSRRLQMWFLASLAPWEQDRCHSLTTLSCNRWCLFPWHALDIIYFEVRRWAARWSAWTPRSRDHILQYYLSRKLRLIYSRPEQMWLCALSAWARFMEPNLQPGGRELWAQSGFLTHSIQINPAWHQTARIQTIKTLGNSIAADVRRQQDIVTTEDTGWKEVFILVLPPLLISGPAPSTLLFTFQLVQSDWAARKQRARGSSSEVEWGIKMKHRCRGARANDARLKTGSPETVEHLSGCRVASALVRPGAHLVRLAPIGPLPPPGVVHCFPNNLRAEAKT